MDKPRRQMVYCAKSSQKLSKDPTRIGTQRVLDALWAYRTAYKVTTKHTPFQLVYGQEAILPIEFEIQSLRIAIDNRLDNVESLKQRCYELEQLDERRA